MSEAGGKARSMADDVGPGATGLGAIPGRRWGAVVIGAGPAGAASALGLARGGLAVLLIDKADWPRAKVCGGCLNAAGLAALERLGARRALAAAAEGPRLERLELAAGRRRAGVPLNPGRAVERRRFDAALVADAVDAGATFLPATAAERIGPTAVTLRQPNSATLHRPSGSPTPATTIQPALVIDATGLGGLGVVEDRPAAHARIGVGASIDDPADRHPPGVIHMACGRAGYVGSIRLPDGRINLAAALHPPTLRAAGGVGPAIRCIFADAGVEPPAALDDARWRGTPTLTRRVDRPWADRLLAVGDAAGYVEPFTGEGIGWALAGGAAVSDRVLAANGVWTPALGEAWARDLRRLVHRRHLRCRAIASLLRRPMLTRAAVAMLQLWPGAVRPVVEAMNRPMIDRGAPAIAPHAKGSP